MSVRRTGPTGTRLHSWSVLGSAEVTPSMRAGMPADHDAGRTGELPVFAGVRRLSRPGRSTRNCRWGFADPDLGAPAPSPAQHPPLRGTSGRACQSRLKRVRSHPDALRQDLPARAPALPGKPALAKLRCPPRSVRRTGWTGTRQPHGPSVSGSAAVTPSMRARMPADHDPARRPWRAPR